MAESIDSDTDFSDSSDDFVGMGGDFFTDAGKADGDVDVNLLRLNTKSITFGDLLTGLRAPTLVEIQI